ncbi:MAG TPA: DegQ family serine endoprotease [Burkholderiaceae bacterium]|nr:DegQ family serine endoprotease [Burkholderiaceae bacterium]
MSDLTVDNPGPGACRARSRSARDPSAAVPGRRASSVLAAGRCWLVAAFAIVSATAASAQVAGAPDFSDLVERTTPAVVNIRTAAKVGVRNATPQGPDLDENDPFNDFLRRFFPPGQGPRPGTPNPGPGQRGPGGVEREVPRGVGSGFLISADGYVMTNYHVIDGADDITVTLPDRREFKATLVGSDQRTDVAVVKIDGTALPLLKIGDPSKLRVGEWVIAIGSPFNLQSTVTHGIVSAKGRETGELLPFIQTDAAVNPGNSGGPLINMRGEVVGINSQIFTTSGAFAGVSFAIPIDEAMRVADVLRTNGRVIRGKIGVSIQDVSRDVAEAIGLGKPMGALVSAVESDGPAEKGGIQAGDVITKFDAKSVDSPNDLRRLVAGTKPGTRSTVTVWRDGAAREIPVTVVEMPSDQGTAGKNERGKPAPSKSDALGLAVNDITPDQLKELHLAGGVVVESSDGAAARAGIAPGDLLLSVNNVPVRNARQYGELVAKLDLKRNIPVLVRRGETTQFVILKPADR